MRLCKFCFFGIFLPITLLCIPLYMRFVSLRPHMFTLSPMDMKLLNHEHTVSTMWCSAQSIRMNSSFNAYLLPEKPKLLRQRQKVRMERKIIDLEDDMKEYWGFFMLADSFFRQVSKTILKDQFKWHLTHPMNTNTNILDCKRAPDMKEPV